MAKEAEVPKVGSIVYVPDVNLALPSGSHYELEIKLPDGTAGIMRMPLQAPFHSKEWPPEGTKLVQTTSDTILKGGLAKVISVEIRDGIHYVSAEIRPGHITQQPWEGHLAEKQQELRRIFESVS